MVAKKRLPSLARRSPPPSHVLGNRRLPDLDAKLEEFAVDSWSAPERVGDADVPDQLPNVQRHLRTTATRSRLPSPIQAKTCAVPTDNGFGSDNCQGAQHIRGQAIQHNKYHPVDAAQDRPLRQLALQDIELVAPGSRFPAKLAIGTIQSARTRSVCRARSFGRSFTRFAALHQSY